MCIRDRCNTPHSEAFHGSLSSWMGGGHGLTRPIASTNFCHFQLGSYQVFPGGWKLLRTLRLWYLTLPYEGITLHISIAFKTVVLSTCLRSVSLKDNNWTISSVEVFGSFLKISRSFAFILPVFGLWWFGWQGSSAVSYTHLTLPTKLEV